MSLNERIGRALVRVFGSRNERMLKEMLPLVEAVNRLEPQMQRLSDAALRAKTDEFRDRLAHGETLDDLLAEAFAVVREASRRVIVTPDIYDPQPMRPFDVQIIGGIVLHRGMIAEMATGEGKTLVATMPCYLNALEGKGVHLVTYNDYLAKVGCRWVGPVYEFLGMTAGVILHGQDYQEKRAAYRCDITFGQNSEFGFDYLRDNMRASAAHQVQQGRLNYAIVDEVDSILIDEARTPLIISGPSEESTEKYYQADRIARRLKKGVHFEVKEKDNAVHLTEEGVLQVEKALGIENIYADRNADWPHHIEQALRAHHLQKRDVDYVVKEGEIVIVDEFTGRQQPGRRWSDGLHQSIEAKEALRIKEENQTLATITYQNFFRLYKKLAGMTGTALTEAAEFDNIYHLDVVVIPTNRPLIRINHPDVVFGTEKEKFDAIEEEIVRQHATGRPLLVGTISIEKSERLSDRLKRRGIKHEVLNAKHHEREAQIVAKAGQMGNVTIATNMAGRGTDIVLGTMTREQLLEHWRQNALAPKDLRADLPEEELHRRLIEHWARHFLDEETLRKTPPERWEEELRRWWKREGMAPLRLCTRVADLGGLHIVGTERHEARRIDNQLRGRAGRQGDPGSSRFFLSLEDDLMRIFAPESVANILRRIGMREGMALESRMVTGSIQRAQKKVEERNFEMRKHLLEYDEVPDEQRKKVYGLRQQALEKEDLSADILRMIEECLLDEIDRAVLDEADPAERNYRPLADWARGYGAEISEEEWRRSDAPALRAAFARAAAANGPQDARQAAARCLRGVTALFCDRERPYTEWDLAGLQTWAASGRPDHILGRFGENVSAEALRARLRAAVVQAAVQRAREAYAAVGFDELVERLLEDATERFLSPSLPAPEWDVEGLGRWGGVLDISLPVRQWTIEEPPEEEAAADFERKQRQDILGRVRQRIVGRLSAVAPADVLSKLIEAEAPRLLESPAEEESGYRALSKWLSRTFEAPVAPADLLRAAAGEMDRIEAEWTDQALQAGSDPERCWASLFDAFLRRDLSRPQRDLARLSSYVARKYGVIISPFELGKLPVEEMGERLMAMIRQAYRDREERLGAEKMRFIEKVLILEKTDAKWKDHLLAMDHLKSGIGLRGYAQLDPKVEYTREARRMFDEMLASLREEVTDLILKLDIRTEERAPASVYAGAREDKPDAAAMSAMQAQREQAAAAAGGDARIEPIRSRPRVARNAPCPCGSGRKYKNCCGKGG